MNGTVIEKDFTFNVAIYYEECFLLNSYNISVTMSIVTDNHREQQVSVDRIEYWLNYILQNSVLIHETAEEQIMKYAYAGIGVCTLPDEPYDQLVSMILLLKLNSITDNKVIITNLRLKSMLSDGVCYSTNLEAAESFYGDTNGWWHSKTISISDYVSVVDPDEKVVNLFDADDWAAAGLNWKEKPHTI